MTAGIQGMSRPKESQTSREESARTACRRHLRSMLETLHSAKKKGSSEISKTVRSRKKQALPVLLIALPLLLDGGFLGHGLLLIFHVSPPLHLPLGFPHLLILGKIARQDSRQATRSTCPKQVSRNQNLVQK